MLRTLFRVTRNETSSRRGSVACRVFLGLTLCLLTQTAQAARIKDVARFDGWSETQVLGYGLVVGLRGTGDGQRAQITSQSIVNMLRNLGIEVGQDQVRLRNVAAVMVTSKVGPFAKTGGSLDVTVSSIGDAKSLEGGTLLMTPLQGLDGEIYAMAQGPLSVGGYNVEGGAGRSAMRRNHVLVGTVPGGALLQKEPARKQIPNQGGVRITLTEADFSSAVAMAQAINGVLGLQAARAMDAATVQVDFPENMNQSPMELMARIENATFEPARTARVVVNEKTGTVVAGSDVTVSEVAVSHAGITVQVNETRRDNEVTALAPHGATVVNRTTQTTQIEVDEPRTEMRVIPRTNRIGDLADALNRMGVRPRDIIAILQAIKQAGALHADLIVM